MRVRLVVMLFIVVFPTLTLAGAPKSTMLSTELGQYPALVGKDLPQFVKRAAELVPSSAIPAEFGPSLLDRIVVVTDAQSFAKAMGIKNLHVMCVELTSRMIYVLMDPSLVNSDPENPLSWVIRAEEEWNAARLKQVTDRGMTYLMAAMLTHELGHRTTEESGSNDATLVLLDQFVRQGKIPPDLVQGYRAVLAPGSR